MIEKFPLMKLFGITLCKSFKAWFGMKKIKVILMKEEFSVFVLLYYQQLLYEW